MSERIPAGRLDRVTVESLIHPGRTRSVDAAKYSAVRDAIMQVLPAKSPGFTRDEARDAVFPLLPVGLFPGGAKAGWYFKVAQLDLEAKGVIAREPVSPLRVHRVAG